MLQSFFIYLLFGFLMYSFGNYSAKRELVYNNLNRKTPFWTWDVSLALLLFALISGIRWNVGVDHLSYLKNYLVHQNFGRFVFEKEAGFEAITSIMAGAGFHFTFYFALLAFLQIFFIFRTFKDERYLYPFLGIVIIFGSEYLSWMNGIRQMIVACIFVYAIQFIRERKLLKYFIVIFLASLMHKSAFILLPFYFIPQLDYFKNRYLTISLIGIAIFLGNNNFWIDSLGQLGDLLGVLGYTELNAERLDTLIQEEQLRNLGPRALIILLTTFATIWYAPKLKERFRNTYFLTYYNLSIIGVLFFNLMSNAHHAFLRPVTYLTIFSLVTTSYLLYFLKENLSPKSIVTFTVVFLLAISYLPMSIVADFGKMDKDFTNYKFFWDNTLKQ